MSRRSRYESLVARRKAHRFPTGLLNPSEIHGGVYDSEHLGPWSRWQGNLEADLLVVGQDWGDLRYFLENQGVDSPHEQTCATFRKLANAAGIDLGTPHQPIPQRVFLTNAVLGIRAVEGKSGPVESTWIDDSLPFLTELIQIIQPRLVVSLGVPAYRACRMAFLGRRRNRQFPLGASLATTHGRTPIRLGDAPVWAALYHCSQRGQMTRDLGLQLEDWRKVGTLLNGLTGKHDARTSG